MNKNLFISHISEEQDTAYRIKAAVDRDFLGFVRSFVSSDTESIAAGEDWLRSVERALRDCSIFVTLCSPESIRRPWINFETGAAWMRDIPIIPVCHSGLFPRDLRMPLSLKQGIALTDADGLKRFYARLAEVLGGNLPEKNFDELATELMPNGDMIPAAVSGGAMRELNNERAIEKRINEALNNPRWTWRTIRSVAIEAAISEELAADILRSDPAVRFNINEKTKERIVGLRSRVGG